jgi:hypothetical protein
MNGFTELKINEKKSVYSKWVTGLPIAHKLYLRTDEWEVLAKVGEIVHLQGELTNGNPYDFDLSDPNNQYKWKGVFNYKKGNQVLFDVEILGLPGTIRAGESVNVECLFVAPDMIGTNKGGIALGIDHFPMTYQSNRIRLVIE